MYILICGFVNGDVTYVGPFPSIKRAEEYAKAYEAEAVRPYRWHVKVLVVPYATRHIARNIMDKTTADNFHTKINPRRV